MYPDAKFHRPRNRLKYTAEAKPRGFLFLRRYPGERIVVVDKRTCAWIKLLEIDAELENVRLEVDGIEEPVVLALYQETTFLQGDGVLRLHAIQEHEHLDRTYASIGVRVPVNMAIRREELVRGLSQEDLHRLAR